MKRKRNKNVEKKKKKKIEIKYECPFTIQANNEEIMVVNLGNIIDSDEYFEIKKGKRIHPYPVGYEIQRKINDEIYTFKILKGKEGPIFEIKKEDEEEEEIQDISVKKVYSQLNLKEEDKDPFYFKNEIILSLFKTLKERKTVKFSEETIDNSDSWITCPICSRTFSKYQITFHLEMKHPKEKKKLIKLINKIK